MTHSPSTYRHWNELQCNELCPPRPHPGGKVTFALIRLFGAVLCLVLLVNASFYQFQIAVLDGSVPVPGFVLKVALLCLLLAAALFRGSWQKSALTGPSVLLLAYLAADLMFLHLHLKREMLEIFVGYNASFSLLFIVLFASSVPLAVSRRAMTTVSLIAFAICGGLGAVQYITQVPVLPLQSNDGNFHVLVWQSGFGLRAFSLFVAPGDFGLFSAFVACYATARIGLGKDPIVSLVLLAAGSYCCYIAGTRSAMISCVLGVVASYLIGRGCKWRFLSLLPLVWILVGVATAIVAYQRAISTAAQTGILGTESFGERILEWRFFAGDIWSRDLSELLFGQGIIQSESVHAAFSAIPIDNIYLALVLQAGVFGLLAVVAFLVQLWRISLKLARESRCELAIAAAAMLSTLFSAGIFTIDSAPYFILMIVVFISQPFSRSQHPSAPLVQSPYALH